MTLGEKLKQLRAGLDMSQPMLADEAGIEQSYLSKLENDKSLPSNEVFRRLLTALQQQPDDFLSQFDGEYIRQHLSKIPDVESWLLRKTYGERVKSRTWFMLSSLLIIIAVPLFYAGYSKALYPEAQYSYMSKGIVLPGEPEDLFDGGFQRSTPIEEFHQKKTEVQRRYDPHRLVTFENLSERFNRPDGEGLRQYRRVAIEDAPRLENKLMQIIAVLLFSAGIMGFILEARLSKRQLL